MKIEIRNAKGNNLKNIDLSLPKNQLIAFTGISGSGKSTLALDTIDRIVNTQKLTNTNFCKKKFN